MAMSKAEKMQLTLGPLLYHWSPERRRDFYFQMADEADVERVYIGEVVCSKREPFFEPYFDEVVERLRKAKKEVVLSTLSLVTTEREMKLIRDFCDNGSLVETNDVSSVNALDGSPFIIGPLVNVFNEGTLAFLRKKGAKRLVMSMELKGKAMEILATFDRQMESEVMVFGKQSLAISMRCYAARAYGLHKDGCQFVCGKDPDGLPADTVEGQKLLTVNGTMLQSHGYVVLMDEMKNLASKGVSAFRLSPQDMNMIPVIDAYRAVMNGKIAPKEGVAKLRAMTDVPFINGFAKGVEGMEWKED
jgi:collagenase-like PrtC family protease